ncbi:4789_t:CDS:2 [Ambispora gerdemannii]|uniref:4789_t:CDS:1 n=1 Tax=Ambispora gerdemannii TaxID=144530 RepID=A0A9N8YPN4_9GLOM|nr:4789_t:CDS:2 [Ambispora gerdemannii]
MDIFLEIADEYFFDNAYASILPLPTLKSTTTIGNTSHVSSSLLLPAISSTLPRDNIYRQLVSLFLMTLVFAYFFYFFFATLSYAFVFDHDLMQHPKYISNQISKEIRLSAMGFPLTTLVTVPWFLGEVKGYSRLYENIEDHGWFYAVFSIGFFLFFTDACVYWIHRWLHTPLIYKRLHKPHHRWIIPTPFSSHAFHPFDGYVQSVPYHFFVYLFPLHKYIYIGLFVFVNMWTIMIHDGAYFASGTFINGAAHHSLHHLYFNYNYGQYFTLWDKIGGSYRLPTEEQLDEKKRKDGEVWAKQAKEVDEFDDNGKLKKN